MVSLEYLQSKIMDINEKWISTAEQTIIILPKTLSHILNIPGMKPMLCLLQEGFHKIIYSL